MDLSYFNPRSQREADFLANFVARQQTLEFFLRQLQILPAEQPARHFLLIAPRGYGKTMLLRRIAIAVRKDPDLSRRFIALSFREEQHNVISLDIFWRNCLQSLLEAREDEDAPASEIEELDAAWDEHPPRPGIGREEQDGAPAHDAFRAHCDRLQRRPLLLIDNLDALLAGLAPLHQWALRRVLQADRGPVLIAAAARYPESTHDPQAAFYDFFRVHPLDKLSDSEVTRCLRTLASHRGDAGKVVLELLDRDPGRVSALNTLAGGNPRTLNVLYSVLESHLSNDILSQLSAMLDTFTGWYQARVDELPLQGRAVFDALALHWDPATAATVGEITGLDTPTVSSQLSRLEKAGYVEAVALNRIGKGRNGYQVSERFFNIWYLMRNGPRRLQQKVRFLTVFLQTCFPAAERHAIAQRALGDDALDPGYALALAGCLPGGSLRDGLLQKAEARSSLLGIDDEYRMAADALRRASGVFGEEAGDVTAATPLDELDAFNLVIQLYGDAEEAVLRERIARALVNKGIVLGQLGRSAEELAAYDEVIARYGDAEAPALREPVARALVNKGTELSHQGRIDEAEASLRQATASASGTWLPTAFDALGNLLLDQRGDPAGAIEAYQAGLAGSPEPDTSVPLHANCAYALALHAGDRLQARAHLDLADHTAFAESGRRLLQALALIVDAEPVDWPRLFERIGEAIEAGDPALWSTYLDDLQRLLWFVIARGQGSALLDWMVAAGFPLRQAPFHHAVVAAIVGEDHLLQINPETRQAAERIHRGLANRLRVYAEKETPRTARRRRR